MVPHASDQRTYVSGSISVQRRTASTGGGRPPRWPVGGAAAEPTKDLGQQFAVLTRGSLSGAVWLSGQGDRESVGRLCQLPTSVEQVVVDLMEGVDC